MARDSCAPVTSNRSAELGQTKAEPRSHYDGLGSAREVARFQPKPKAGAEVLLWNSEVLLQVKALASPLPAARAYLCHLRMDAGSQTPAEPLAHTCCGLSVLPAQGECCCKTGLVSATAAGCVEVEVVILTLLVLFWHHKESCMVPCLGEKNCLLCCFLIQRPLWLSDYHL